MMPTTNAALITGASAGIGAGYANWRARCGHDLMMIVRDVGRLDAPTGRLRAEAGHSVQVLAAELSGRPDLLRMAQRHAAKRYGTPGAAA